MRVWPRWRRARTCPSELHRPGPEYRRLARQGDALRPPIGDGRCRGLMVARQRLSGVRRCSQRARSGRPRNAIGAAEWLGRRPRPRGGPCSGGFLGPEPEGSQPQKDRAGPHERRDWSGGLGPRSAGKDMRGYHFAPRSP
ncbi:hypothetical protein NDU88_004416 [Pleurodeles waltl]|uniref:Uncharacterized protein n=1 Tax=Pleurodeles waltl TaxID=8319 RepID=A0AAV7MVE2_PLEWA|nr:hypothetical protein NDU88_004416 [Pleurodeles waltl]